LGAHKRIIADAIRSYNISANIRDGVSIQLNL